MGIKIEKLNEIKQQILAEQYDKKNSQEKAIKYVEDWVKAQLKQGTTSYTKHTTEAIENLPDDFFQKAIEGALTKRTINEEDLELRFEITVPTIDFYVEEKADNLGNFGISYGFSSREDIDIRPDMLNGALIDWTCLYKISEEFQKTIVPGSCYNMMTDFYAVARPIIKKKFSLCDLIYDSADHYRIIKIQPIKEALNQRLRDFGFTLVRSHVNQEETKNLIFVEFVYVIKNPVFRGDE